VALVQARMSRIAFGEVDVFPQQKTPLIILFREMQYVDRAAPSREHAFPLEECKYMQTAAEKDF